jgi:hypothetical protein
MDLPICQEFFLKKFFYFFCKKLLTNDFVCAIILSEGKGESLQERNQPLAVRWKLPQASKSPPLRLTIDALRLAGSRAFFVRLPEQMFGLTGHRTNVLLLAFPNKCSERSFLFPVWRWGWAVG